MKLWDARRQDDLHTGGAGHLESGWKLYPLPVGVDPQGVPGTLDAILEAPHCLLAGTSSALAITCCFQEISNRILTEVVFSVFTCLS